MAVVHYADAIYINVTHFLKNSQHQKGTKRRKGEEKLTNEERARIIRVELARREMAHGDLARMIDRDRQNVSRIALSGKPGVGCVIRQALSRLAGTPCGEFWACSTPEGEVKEEEISYEENNTEVEKNVSGQ